MSFEFVQLDERVHSVSDQSAAIYPFCSPLCNSVRFGMFHVLSKQVVSRKPTLIRLLLFGVVYVLYVKYKTAPTDSVTGRLT